MTVTTSASESIQSGQPQFLTDSHRHRSNWLVIVAAAFGVVGQLLFSNDWCLYTVPAAILAAFAFFGAACVLSFLTRSDKVWQWRLGSILAIVIGLGSGAGFRVILGWAFSEAFGIDQPPGIIDLRIQRHYEGGPGEHSLIFEFTADHEAILTLTHSFSKPDKYSQRPATWDLLVEKYGAPNAWMSAYELFGGAFHANGRKTWSGIVPLNNPEIFFEPASQRNHGKSVLVLYDRAAHRVVVLHSRS